VRKHQQERSQQRRALYGDATKRNADWRVAGIMRWRRGGVKVAQALRRISGGVDENIEEGWKSGYEE
jgi:hypothetical protein